MSKEKNFLENDFVSYKNEKIVFCQDGRIFLIDKDTELVDLRDCENCKQKDQRIAELEKELKLYQNIMCRYFFKYNNETPTSLEEIDKSVDEMLKSGGIE